MIYSVAQTLLQVELGAALLLAGLAFRPPHRPGRRPLVRRLSAALQLRRPNRLLSNGCQILGAGLLACLLILLAALVKSDPSLISTAGKTAPELALRFRISALWAGPQGSLLCWAAGVGAAGVLFSLGRAARTLPPATARRFWGYYYLILAFFLFMLCFVAPPFAAALPEVGVSRSAGLAPALRHIAMSFHPPLIFLGYAALVIPAALGLARLNARTMRPGPAAVTDWIADSAARRWLTGGLLLLGAGIVTGMWWAYTDLGWGGYWTWDPVENLSLLPLLAGGMALTAARLRDLRLNAVPTASPARSLSASPTASLSASLAAFAAILPFAAALFTTFVVRSGLLVSKHAYIPDEISPAPLGFALLLIALGLVGLWRAPKGPLPPLDLQGGTALFQICLPAALGLSLGLGTFRPWFAALFGQTVSRPDNAWFIAACLPPVCLWLLCELIRPEADGSATGGGRGAGAAIKAAFLLLPALLGVRLGFPGVSGFWNQLYLGLCGALTLGALGALGAAVRSIRSIRPGPLRRRPLPRQYPLPGLSRALRRLGLGLLGLGLGLSSLLQQQWDIRLVVGQPEQNAIIAASGYVRPAAPLTAPLFPPNPAGLRADNLEFSRDMSDGCAVARLTLSCPETPGATPAFRIVLEQRAYGDTVLAKTAYRHGLTGDFGFTVLQLYPDRSALIRVSNRPFINLIWLGAALIGLASLPLLAGSGLSRRAAPTPRAGVRPLNR